MAQFDLIFKSTTSTRNIHATEISQYSNYPIYQADAQLTEGAGIWNLRQYVMNGLLQHEVFESRLEQEEEVMVLLHEDSFFLVYVLYGRFSIRLPGSNKLLDASAGQYLVVYLSKGSYPGWIHQGHTAIQYAIPAVGQFKHAQTDYPELYRAAQLQRRMQRGYKVLPLCLFPEKHTHLMDQLRNPQGSCQTSKELAALYAFHEIMCGYNGQLADKDYLAAQTRKGQVYKAKDYIVAAVSKGGVPSLADIAAHAGCRQKPLSFGFKTYMGKNLQEFLNDERLREGKRLVLETNLTISEIAYVMGYEFARNFAQAFKLKYGYAPSDLRKDQEK